MMLSCMWSGSLGHLNVKEYDNLYGVGKMETIVLAGVWIFCCMFHGLANCLLWVVVD